MYNNIKKGKTYNKWIIVNSKKEMKRQSEKLYSSRIKKHKTLN